MIVVAGPVSAVAVVLAGLVGVMRRHLWNLTRSSIAVAVIVFFCGLLWFADIPALLAPLRAVTNATGLLQIMVPAQLITSMYLTIALTVQFIRNTKRGRMIVALSVVQLTITALCAFGFWSLDEQRQEFAQRANAVKMVPQDLNFVPAAPLPRQN